MRLMAGYDAIRLVAADQLLYRRFRSLEPGLVSCIDGEQPSDARLDILAVELFGAAAGVCSLVVRTNPHKPDGRNRYGRVDLVIVERQARGLDLGRLLTLAGVVQMLADHGEQLYSISCLAAHPAIAHILEDVGFQPDDKRDDTYCHEQLKLDDPSRLFALRTQMLDATVAAAQSCNFRIRQQRDDVPHRGVPAR